MKNILQGMVAATFVATSGVAAAAVDGYVNTSLSDTAKLSGGEWKAAATWNPSGEPADNARITFSATANCHPTLTLDSDVSREFRLLFFQLNNTISSITIDGSGKTLVMPYSETGYYEATAFNAYAGTRYFFSVRDGSSNGKAPVLSWTNPLMTAGYDGNRSYMNFARGTFDFRDIDGVTSTRPVYMANSGTAAKPTSIFVGDGARFVAGAVTFCGCVEGDEFVFGGGQGDLSALNVSDTDAATPHAFALTLTNGAFLALGSLSDTHKASAAGPVTFTIDAEDSTLAVTNGDFALTPSTQAETELQLVRSTLAVTNGVAKFGGAATSAHAVRVSAADSAIQMPSYLTVGATTGNNKLGVTTFAATNTAFDVYGLDLYAGTTMLLDKPAFDYSHNPNVVSNVLRNGSSLTIKGSAATLDLGNMTVGGRNPNNTSNTDPAVLTLDGGSFTMGTINDVTGIGVSVAANGAMILTNGATLTVTGSKHFEIGNDSHATGRLEIYDGTFDYQSTGEFAIGNWGATSARVGSGCVKVGKGGVLKTSSGTTVDVGRYCVPGRLEICDGGRAELGNVIMEQNSFHGYNSGITNRLVQTGGELTMTALEMARSCNRCEAHFLGGTAATRVIRPGADLAAGREHAEGCVYGNGGTIVAITSDPSFISGLTTFEIGAKGLTIDAATKAIGIVQDVSDMDGEQGVLTLTGGGTVTLAPPNAWTVSRTAVVGTTLKFSSSAPSLATTLEVGTGGILSLEGMPTELTLSGLTVNGGAIVIDPGDVIRVPAAGLNLRGLEIRYATEPEIDDVRDLFVITGALSDENRHALELALDGIRTPDTYTDCVIETVDGTSHVKIVKRNRGGMITSFTDWQSETTDGWSQDGSWSDGVPTVETAARFSSSGAMNVSVPEGAVVGALRFDGSGYRLTGETPLEMPAEEGAAMIFAGTDSAVELAVPLKPRARLEVQTEEGASVRVSGDIVGGGLVKTGTGRLELAGENAFDRSICQHAGYLIARSAASLGVSAENIIELSGDTLWITNDTGAAVTIANPVRVKTDELLSNTSIRNDVDVTLKNLSVTQGGLAKWGSGKLTIEVKDGMELAPTVRSTGSSWVYKKDFGEDGTVPDNTATTDGGFVGAFSVGAGEVVFKPAEGETKPTVAFSKDSLVVGMQIKDRGVAKCTFDGVRVTSGSYIMSCYNLANTGGINPNRRPEMRLVNGAEIEASVFAAGRAIYFAKSYPLLAVTNSSITARTLFTFSGQTTVAYASQTSDSAAVVRTDGATFASDDYLVGQGVDVEISNSVLGPRTKDCAKLWARWSSSDTVATHGTMLFNKGSVMKVNAFGSFNLVTNWYDSAEGPVFSLAFDDATWDFGGGHFLLASDTFSKYVAVRMVGKGLRLAPAAGTSFSTSFPFTGEGGLIVDGAGTVRFFRDTVRFTGPIDVRSGTLDLSEAGQLGALTLKGTGTVKGGSFAGLCLVSDAQLKFDGTDFGETLTVDFGRTAENPLTPAELKDGIEIGTISGAAPVLPANVRGINTGLGSVRGTVGVVGNKLVATLSRPGMMVIVR